MFHECIYCLTTNPIQLCSCKNYICLFHNYLHKQKNHYPLYSIINKKIISNKLSLNEILNIEFQLKLKKYKKCNHKLDFNIKFNGCECKHEWICICGYKGCGRNNYSMDNKLEHSYKHFKETDHPIVIKIDDDLIFCYKCDDFVFIDDYYFICNQLNLNNKFDSLDFKFIIDNSMSDNEIYNILCDINNNGDIKMNDNENIKMNDNENNSDIKMNDNENNGDIKMNDNENIMKNIDFNINDKNEILKNNNYPELGKLVKNKNYIGIKNLGNTCYASSLLLFLGNIFINENIDFNFHYEICDENPLECFSCQFMRFLNILKLHKEVNECMNDKSNNNIYSNNINNTSYYDDNINNFVINNYYNSHKNTKILNIDNFLKIIEFEFGFIRGCQYDSSEFLCIIINKIQELELLGLIPKMSDIFTMETKKLYKNYTETLTFLPLEMHKLLKESIDKYFTEENIRIKKLPKYLILNLKRYSLVENEILKISDPIFIDDINLGEYFYDDDTNNGKYKYFMSICHIGSMCNSGHYVLHLSREYFNKDFIIDDENLLEGNIKENGYIICLKSENWDEK